MSTLSFKAFCIEYYAAHIGRPSNEVYALFEQTGLLNLREEDYEDLHGMSMEWLELVVTCRSRTDYFHGYDIVEGKIANDNVGETVSYVMQGIMRKEDAIERLRFEQINNQIAFCTEAALHTLHFQNSYICRSVNP